jgi:ActR/RegA family two-component response regulator
MDPLSVVVAQADLAEATRLSTALRQHFRTVHIAASFEELFTMVPRQRAEVAVIDLELVDLANLVRMRSEFPSVVLVCTHRLANDALWSAALAAGAADCCYPSDVRGIVMAVYRSAGRQAKGAVA